MEAAVALLLFIFYITPHRCDLSHSTEEVSRDGGTFSSKARGGHGAARETQGGGRRDSLWFRQGSGVGKVQGG